MGEAINTRVVVRCRPINDTEKSKGATRVVKVSGDRILLHNPFPSSVSKEHNFTFDNCYYGDVKTDQVFKDVGVSLVQKALDGYNISIIAYGQTGSGKSYTIEGCIEEQGILNMMIERLFSALDGNSKTTFCLTASFVQVSENGVHDLLNPSGRDLQIRHHPQLGTYIDDVAELIVCGREDVVRLHEQGNRVRKLMASDFSSTPGSTSTVFTITVDQKVKGHQSGKGLVSKITFVDLAGSEHRGNSEDAKPVHSSIAALQATVATLAKKQNPGVVGYRTSKLARLLQGTLGGHSYTTILGTISPTDSDFYETLATLQFLNQAKHIECSPRKNENDTGAIIKEIRDEINRLREKMVSHSSSPSDAPNSQDVETMEGLVKDLQLAKLQTWDEKERQSATFEEERRHHLANKGILDWVLDTSKKESKEVQERLAALHKEKDKLLIDYKERRKALDERKDELQDLIAEYSKLTETGKSGDEEGKQKVSEIHQLKEKLKEENEVLKKIKQEMKDVQDKLKAEKEEAKVQTSSLIGHPELRQKVESEQREKAEKENLATLAEEMERVKTETEQEKAELKLKRVEGTGFTADSALNLEMTVLDLKAEKAIMAFKIKSLESEKKLLKNNIDESYKRHKDELELQQLQYFQTFRSYREVFEEQKAALEQRYRGILEDSIQDAIFLSARNQELMEENQVLKQELAECQDNLTMLSGRPTSPLAE